MKEFGRRTIRFGVFEADPAAGELRKGGRRINLQDQPFRLLMSLLEHPGEIVTRAELRDRLWGDVNVDFEEGLNSAIRKVREALGDSATNPRYIETLPRRGYRFIGPAEVIDDSAQPDFEASKRVSWPAVRWFWLACCAAAVILAGFLLRAWVSRKGTAWTASPPIQLTRDSGLTTEPAISRDGKLLVYASDRAGAGNLDIWVQHIPGGEARRLTTDPADDHEPDISPDGSEIIFRSERDGGGIYSVPALGGEHRLLIKEGYVPRFSPDGSHIAYAVGAFGTGGFMGKLHVYSPANGSTKVLAEDLEVAGPVSWSPDGKSLVFAAAKDYLLPIYLWTCPVDRGPAIQLSATPVTEEPAQYRQLETVSVAWFGSQLIVSAKRGDSSNLWSATLPPGARKLSDELKRITLGSGHETLPSASSDGRIVFANHVHSINIWQVDLHEGAQSMRPLTENRALNYRPSIAGDGSIMAYISNRTGNVDVWQKNLVSGEEVALTRATTPVLFAAISRDGSQIAYTDGVRVYIRSRSGGAPRLLCEKCGRPDDWSPDGKLILSPSLDTKSIDVRDLISGRFTTIITHPSLVTTAPRVSPDGKWLTFHTSDRFKSRQVFLVPYIEQQAPSSTWIAVTDGSALDREPAWAADGNLIYFLSDRDGFRCVWGRRLDPKTKLPEGSIFPVLHLHNTRLSLLHVPNTGDVGLWSLGGKMIFAMGELTGNIWMTDFRQR
jgi:Tol biopolymer transport system component/DNA-binding winged helix-turn-helix (wHTH) protein